MTAQIKRLERQVDTEIVGLLERVLEDAKAGKIKDIVIVCDDLEEGGYFRSSEFRDRWRLLGALEYAKDAVQRG